MQILRALVVACALLAGGAASQPLEGRATRLSADPDLKMTATPSKVAGEGGWVTVAFEGYSFGEDADWIGLWCGGKPISSSPLKFKTIGSISTYPFANGTARFFLQNLRADCEFALINGGQQFQNIKGVSNPVTFLAPAIPMGVRVAFVDPGVGSDVRATASMRVSWNSPNDASTSRTRQAVRWGLSADEMRTIVHATNDTYTAADMCDTPASTMGWSDPGLFQSAVVSNLTYDTIVFYSVGDLSTERTDKARWSPVSTFITPPKPGQSVSGSGGEMRFLAFGDMGQAPVDGAQQHSWDYNNHGELSAVNTTNKMAAEFDNEIAPSFVLHIGDISYAVGYLSEWDQFTEQVRPIASRVPWMTAIGNHEMGGADTYFAGSDSGGECGVPYSAYYRMPAPADTGRPTSPWYTFRYGMVAFVVMSTEHDFTGGSQQYAWIEEALGAVDRSITPFVVFAGHRPMYIDSTWNDPTVKACDQTVATSMRKYVEPLLVKYRVDLAVWGHHHSYQRTCAVSNETCTEGAPVHAVIGMAGYQLTHSFNKVAPTWIASRTDQHWGYTRVAVNATHMRMQFLADDTNDVLDDFSIAKKEGL